MFDETAKQRYIDSYSFLPMALAKTSAALNLTTTEKGYFPHLFNRLENQNFVGPYPSKHYYGYNNMSDSARAKFDQWYDTLAGKIFDFRKEIGCYHHGHDCRYRADYIHPQSKIPFGTLMTMFNDRIEILQRVHHLDTEVMWECQWASLKQTDPHVIDFMSTYSAPERLKPRDALFGGRTNAYKLYHKVTDGEKVRYVDFTSLYPYCQARKSYPIGHPEIIHSDFENIENYYGFIKAKMLPPRKLLHPVLPLRSAGQLMFPLCCTCAETQSKVLPCAHTDDERAITGTWVSLELLKAIEKGYVVVNVYEVWHFSQRSDSLFCDYVKTFLQFKQQASGYPSDVITDADKRSYIEDYHKKEGIKLDAEKIAHNPAQRTRLSTSHFCLTVLHCVVQYRHAEGSFYETRDVNVFIGAFTTAHARLELYNLMDKLGDRLLYSDTDSLIYVTREGDWEPPLGPYLGELTDEVGSDDFITEYCSSGPKTYGYTTAKGKVCMCHEPGRCPVVYSPPDVTLAPPTHSDCRFASRTVSPILHRSDCVSPRDQSGAL
ncbi:hypothetical protein M9458_054352 [Cirrhinus mrigala]|uniref:DNA-directed DNA polymerase n=1 Tax=Cirrhinus mrigala TaxID=683832 RepID=A0ABD0MJL5_CIRMR